MDVRFLQALKEKPRGLVNPGATREETLETEMATLITNENSI